MNDDIDDPESAIPWPGFVDILSAVIMVFIFFVMVTVVIISQLDRKKTEYQSASTIKVETITEVKNMSQEELVAILEKNKELQRQLEAIQFTQDNNSKSVKQDIKVLQDEYAIIQYGDLGVTMLDKISEALEKLPHEGRKISLISYVPQNIGFTTMQEIALNRSFNIRNFYLDKGIAARDVKLKINKDVNEGLGQCQNNSVYGCVHIQISK